MVERGREGTIFWGVVGGKEFQFAFAPQEYSSATSEFQTSGSCDRASLKQEKKEPTDDKSIDVYSQQVNSTCFGHHYAHRQENRLCKTACGVSLDVLAAVVWSQDTS